MADGVRTTGADDLDRIAAALKQAADTDLNKQVSAAMRKVARPLGAKVIEEGSQDMPQRGGLAARIRELGRVGVSNSLRGRVTSVNVILKHRGVNLRSLDAGVLRHPVFGNRGVWVQQQVPGGAFSRAFEREAPKVRGEVTRAAQDVLEDVAKSV